MTSKPYTSDEALREKLAAIEHERWADWQKWCHKVIRENSPSPETLKVLERWDTQIATPYKDLSRNEQLSDLEQVDRYWQLILADREKHVAKARKEELNFVGRCGVFGRYNATNMAARLNEYLSDRYEEIEAHTNWKIQELKAINRKDET